MPSELESWAAAATETGASESRACYGPEAFRELAGSSLDAVDGGKHVFPAKPLAVDVPGCHSTLASGRRADSRELSCLADSQARAYPAFH